MGRSLMGTLLTLEDVALTARLPMTNFAIGQLDHGVKSARDHGRHMPGDGDAAGVV